jgi:hypothetical protein
VGIPKNSLSVSVNGALGVEETRVRQLIAAGKYKNAVESAKEIHKAQRTDASEALLVDAYAARIQSLHDQNLVAEAKSLEELVRERYPAVWQRRNGHDGAALGRAGKYDDLLRPLSDPELTEERRAAIEEAVRREVSDLGALAECAVLPSEHPLRQAASTLQAAFVAVTSGPVGDEAIELPQVSRRSPLASWKLLVRAIACLYRGEDAAGRRWLDAIHPESAPARLVPALEVMFGTKRTGLTAASSALISSVICDPAPLRRALEALDRALDSHNSGAIHQKIREAIQACRTLDPGEVERLKKHIAVRSAIAGLNKPKVEAAMGGGPREDAYFFRLFARAMEQSADLEDLPMACAAWDQFRQAAVREGWFTANGPEAATLYLHMAEVVRKLPHDLLAKLASRQNKKAGEDLYFIQPDKLYERACALDPHFEAFAQWMDWAKWQSKSRAVEVAEAWHRIRPTDIEPILHLVDAKEQRRAFQTSLQYLAKAEQIDSVHPSVRRARLRLLAGSVLRHLQQKKPHLADEKLEQMTALPQSRQGDRPAFLAALRYMVCSVRGAVDQAVAHRAELERIIESKAAAWMLIYGVAAASKQAAIERVPGPETLGKQERAAVAAAVVRVAALAKDMQITQSVPMSWIDEAERQFQRSSHSFDVGQLQILAETGLFAENHGLVFAATAVGLERGEASAARFLLLRARALPLAQRRGVCLLAAAQFARRQRDMETVDEAVNLIAGSPFEDISLTDEQAATVIEREKKERKVRPGPSYSDVLGIKECNCPDCRRKRGEDVSPFEDFDDEDKDDDLDLGPVIDGMDLPPGLPPEMAKMLFSEATKAIERGESMDSFLNRVFGPGPRTRGRRKRGRRR